MKNSNTRSSLLLPAVGLLAVACGGGGGGGGGGATVNPTATVQGSLRMPEVAPTAVATTANMDWPMVPGEVVVWLEPGQDANNMSCEGFDLVRAGQGRMAVFHARCAEGRSSIKDGARVEDSVEKATCDAAEEMKGMPGVRTASPNYIYQSLAQPNDPLYPVQQWHYDQVNMQQAWDLQQGSSDVIVAVLDSGIVSSHPDFSGRLVGGFDMISDPFRARDGDGRDADPEDVGDLQTPQGSSFHGTHVAGTIGANANDGVGGVGVDWNCKLMNVRCLGFNGGTSVDIADAILWAAGLPNGSGTVPPQRAEIINMSLGGPGIDTIMQQACDQAAASGVLLIAAAGNDNSDFPQSPAAFDSVLSVGASDSTRGRAPYSNFSPTVDLWAPGGNGSIDLNGDGYGDGVLSSIADDAGNLGYTFKDGTSMAAPHVAGIASLIKATNPNLTATEIRQILIGTAVSGLDLPNQGRLVDAFAAVQAAGQQGGGQQPSAPVLVAETSLASFGPDDTQLRINVENRGTGNLVLDGGFTMPQVNWLAVQSTDLNPNDGIQGDQLILSVDRSNLNNGVETTTLTLNYLDGGQMLSLEIQVRIQTGQSTVTSDTVFVLLVDPVSFETKYQTETSVGESFSFAMQGVENGTYLLIAGTDRNDDGFLGDSGELFGAYPSLDNPIPVQIVDGQAMMDLSFSLQETTSLQSLASGNASPLLYRRMD